MVGLILHRITCCFAIMLIAASVDADEPSNWKEGKVAKISAYPPLISATVNLPGLSKMTKVFTHDPGWRPIA
jgi:hypothetical protein